MNQRLFSAFPAALVCGFALVMAAEIHDDVRDGDAGTVARLLKKNPKPVNLADEDKGTTPLHHAVDVGNLELVIARLEEAIADKNKFAAEDLLAGLETQIPGDGRLAGWREAVAAVPELERNLTVACGGGVTMEFILIRPGAFTMGSDMYADSKPCHKVTITQPFYLGKTEVTQEQWEKVMAGNPSHFKGAKHPVEQVSWYDCQNFVEKLQEKVPAQTFRLPTEAEWEYACRAGATGNPCAGDGKGALPECARFTGNAGLTTHPVGAGKPNAWGLYDMHGNVWEWCADQYGNYPATAGVDPQGAQAGSYQVSRGGTWPYIVGYCHAAGRNYGDSNSRDKLTGFRMACQPYYHAIQKDSRYIGSSADWLKLRRDLEGISGNSYERARLLEARQLATNPAGVRRDGKALILKAGNGREVRLVDKDVDNAECTYFSYYDTVPALDAYVIHVQPYEGESWLLVSRKTGVKTKLSELPVVSPDKQRFATASPMGYDPTELVIWSIRKDGSFRQEMFLEPSRWSPSFLQWLSPARLRVRCDIPAQDWKAPPVARIYQLGNGKWRQFGNPEPWKE